MLKDEQFFEPGEKTFKGNTPVSGRSVMLLVKAQ